MGCTASKTPSKQRSTRSVGRGLSCLATLLQQPASLEALFEAGLGTARAVVAKNPDRKGKPVTRCVNASQ